MIIENPTPKNFDEFYKEFGITKERIQQDVKILKDWFEEQPHLPKFQLKDAVFEAMLMRSKFSMERSKQTLDMHFALRSAVPEVFSDRDPMSADMQHMFNLCTCVFLPRVTQEGYRVVIFRVDSKDTSNYMHEVIWRRIFMLNDYTFREGLDMSLGSQIIIDYENFMMGHVSNMTLALLKKVDICHKKGYGMRLKGIHFINPPPFMAMLISLFKSFLKTKMAARLHVHTELETLYKHVDRELLPVDYGGNEKKLTELGALCKKEIELRRDWFMEHEVTDRVDESKRPGKMVDTSEIFGIEGSFKKLDFD